MARRVSLKKIIMRESFDWVGGEASNTRLEIKVRDHPRLPKKKK